LIRLVRPLKGAPLISIRLRPTFDWGSRPADRTSGSNHIRYLCKDLTLRLSTNCPVSHILTERPFRLEEPLTLFLGPDEPFEGDLTATGRRMFDETSRYWREWVRTLAVPLDWQDAVIRAAITLKLCAYEETGAIIAALTTSIPEHADSGRNWDYRYCTTSTTSTARSYSRAFRHSSTRGCCDLRRWRTSARWRRWATRPMRSATSLTRGSGSSARVRRCMSIPQ
jgi:hypothetical protein